MRHFLFLVLLTQAVAFAAAGPTMAQEKIDCTNAMTQTEMTYCAEQDWQEADRDLNIAYKAAIAYLTQFDALLPEAQRGGPGFLKDAQRAWIPFRDNACAAYGFLARGGTMEPMLIYSCRADLTRKRTQELKELSEGLGN